MSVRKPKNSPYYYYEFEFKGRRFHRSTGETDRAAAERIEAKARADARRAAVAIPDDVDRDWAAYHLVKLRDEVRSLSKAVERVADDARALRQAIDGIEDSLERLTGKGAPRAPVAASFIPYGFRLSLLGLCLMQIYSHGQMIPALVAMVQ